MSERWPDVAAAAVVLRDVGTGGSLAGKEGVTVLWAVGAEGVAALYVEDVPAGFAVVVDVACALGGLA